MTYRVFQGHTTTQTAAQFTPAAPQGWYWQPADYTGQVLWSAAYATPHAAHKAAQAAGHAAPWYLA